MRPFFKQLEGGRALWMRTAFVAALVLLFVVVAWTSFSATHRRTPRIPAFGGCNGPLGGIGR